ncbi:MAG: hypothetical protein V7752_05265 [Halopseudomonas sp.]
MSDQQTVEIRLNDEAQALFAAYQGYTGATAEDYIEALVVKTLPTLKALVEALQEAGEDGDAVMEIFGRKMAESVLQQQQAAQDPAAANG